MFLPFIWFRFEMNNDVVSSLIEFVNMFIFVSTLKKIVCLMGFCNTSACVYEKKPIHIHAPAYTLAVVRMYVQSYMDVCTGRRKTKSDD